MSDAHELYPRPRRAAEGGFTLVEMLFALGVLMFGVTSLIGVLSVGVSTRRTAEQRSQAALLVDEVVHAIEQDVLGRVKLAGEAEFSADLEIDPIEDQPLEAYPGMKYSARFTVDDSYPWLVLATIDVAWLQQGAAVAQTFHRLLNRQKPFSQRVAERRKKT